jgi:tetratricopeptide (TPR) repeat protein
LAYIEIDKYQEAITDFSKAIEFSSDFATAYNNRGFSYAKLDKHDTAIKDYTKAIELDPNDMDAYRNRADIYDVLERYNEAISVTPNFSQQLKNRKGLYQSSPTQTHQCRHLERQRRNF